jgi:hypothetical protein
MKGFVADYLATATSNPDTAFSMLTPGFQQQSGGIDSYTGYWRTIADAQLRSVSADPRNLTVAYDVLYTRTDGSQAPGSTSLQLVYQDGRYLIAGES